MKDDKISFLSKFCLVFYKNLKVFFPLDSKFGLGIYRFLYFIYKRYFDDPHELFLKKYLTNNDIRGVVLDIGANYGYTTWVFEKFFPKNCLIYSFEPELKAYLALEKKFSNNQNIILVNKALGSVAGEVGIVVNHNHPADHHVQPIINQSGLIQRIQIDTVDSYLKAVKNELPVLFVKMDVQGFELNVLKGMEKTIKKNQRLVLSIEIDPGRLKVYNSSIEEIFGFLELHEFSYFYLNLKGKELSRTNIKEVKKLTFQLGYVDLICTSYPLI